MKGSVRKRGNTWSYYFDIGSINGKRQKKEKGGFKTKRDAEVALSTAITKYNTTGQIYTPSDKSMSDYLDEWYKLYVVMNLKYNTQMDYASILKNHLKPAFGTYRIRALTPAVIQEYVNGLKTHGYARATAFNIFRTLSGALSYAVEPLHYIDYNPCDRVRFPKYGNTKQTVHVFLSTSDMNRILARFDPQSPFYVPIMIGYHTGVRISECFGLTWNDIDLVNDTITINKQIVKRNPPDNNRKKSQWYFQTPKTVSSTRKIKFGRTLHDVLVTAHHDQLKNKLSSGDMYTDHYLRPEQDEKGDTIQHIIPVSGVHVDLPKCDLVCIRTDGTMITPDSFKYVTRIVRAELGIDFNYHSLRHTHATMLIEGNADIKDVQERLGHTNIQTTMNKYVHNTEEMQSRTVDIFERMTKV